MWHFLFDLDGTILDTTELILKSFVYAFREGLGETVSTEELMVHFGRPLEEQFRVMRPQLSGSEIDRLVNIYRQHNEMEHDRWVCVVPGADTGLRNLHDAGFPLGIVTSKRLNMTIHGLKLFSLDSLFQVIVHMDSTVNHKPHPEPVLHALELMGGVPQKAVYMGDSPYDMMSGHDAEVKTVGFVYNTFTCEVLKHAGADRVVSTWRDASDILLQSTRTANK